MLVNETKIRVYYEDTDHKQIEDSGILLPARSVKINYIEPAHYHDLLTVRTIVDQIPKVKFIIGITSCSTKGKLFWYFLMAKLTGLAKHRKYL